MLLPRKILNQGLGNSITCRNNETLGLRMTEYYRNSLIKYKICGVNICMLKIMFSCAEWLVSLLGSNFSGSTCIFKYEIVLALSDLNHLGLNNISQHKKVLGTAKAPEVAMTLQINTVRIFSPCTRQLIKRS